MLISVVLHAQSRISLQIQVHSISRAAAWHQNHHGLPGLQEVIRFLPCSFSSSFLFPSYNEEPLVVIAQKCCPYKPQSRLFFRFILDSVWTKLKRSGQSLKKTLAVCEVEKMFLFCSQTTFIHNKQLWASASEPTGSVPTTQSPERKVGTIALWPLARAC